MKHNQKKWIDVSVTLHSGMVHWPGDPAIVIKRTHDIDKGDVCNVSHLSMGSHTGTHMDAPLHFLHRGKGLDHLPFDATIGPARVIHIQDRASIKVKELKKHQLKKGERILFKTINSSRCWAQKKFVRDFVYVSKEAAEYLAGIKVRVIGVDYLSVGGFYKDGLETHQALLKSGVWIIEGLNLSKVRQGNYDLICLPLKIFNSDGAPARAIIRKKRRSDA